MGSNRLELLLSLIDDSERNLKDGMKKSCESICSDLFKHIQHMKNNARDIDIFDRIKVNAVAMSREVKAEGWAYALTACYSMKNHMKFLSMAIEDILGEIRLVMADYVSSLVRITEGKTFENTKVFENRPHSLGGVRPPDPKSIASAVILQGEGLADISFIREAMSKIRLENDIFEREYGINKRLIRFDDRATSVVYAPTPGEDENEEEKEDDNTRLTPPVVRSVDDGAAWRPPFPEGSYPWWWYDFSNVWGDKGLSIKALTDFITRVVAPKALMARAILTMCVHLRNCAQSILEIELYKVMESPFNSKRVWDDIVNVKLEWFMVIAVLILFLDDKKDKFTSALLNKDDNAEENIPVLLTNVVESLPPWLLVKDWARRNLYNWPQQLSEETQSHSGNRIRLESALASSLVDRFVICRPGEEHPILSFVNNSNRTLRHRISSTKAEFLKAIICELKNEAMYGTQWLINGRRKESSSGEGATIRNNFGVFVKNDSTPLFSNPMYRTKLLSSRNHQIIINSIRPLLSNNRKGVGKGSGEWITLDLKMSFSKDLATFWKNVSPRNVKYCDVEQQLERDIIKLKSKIEEQKKTEEEQTRQINITEDRLKKFLSGLRTANVNAEKSIFLVCLWKSCADQIMGLLSSTAEL